MSTKGQVILADVWAMLDHCLPGYQKEAGPHHWRIHANGKTYPSLPKGEHGKRPGRAPIQKKQIRDLAEFFGIRPCAQGELPILGRPRALE